MFNLQNNTFGVLGQIIRRSYVLYILFCAQLGTLLELFDIITINLDMFEKWNTSVRDFLASPQKVNAFDVRL